MTDRVEDHRGARPELEGVHGPLAGIRVLDLTTFLSGPYGTQMLADLGAEVLKLESPVGDLSRSIAPHFVRGDSLYFHTINRNKRSIAVDLKHPAAPALVRDLIGTVDVVIENFRPGVMSRLGLDPGEILSERPDLIWCSISGFGQTGPYRSLQAYDMVVQAMSGSMSITGEPGRPGVRAGIPLGDLAAGLHAVVAVLASLHRRAEDGQGEYIDVSMLDCLVSMLSYQATYYLQSGQVPSPQGRAHDSIPTYRAFTAGDDREVVITANTEAMWVALCEAIGRPDLVGEERFADNASRLEHKEALLAELEPAFRSQPARHWVERFNELGVPAALVNSFDDVFSDAHVAERQMVLDLEAEDGARVKVPGNPIKLKRLPRQEHRFPPKLGGDTDVILQEALGLDEQAIDALRQDGLFG